MKKPTRTGAQLAMCHECLGYYQDGKMDCENVRCPHYSWQPYRKLTPDLSWMKYNPRKKGKVTWEESQREMSEEHKEKLRKALEAHRAAKPMKRSPV